MTPLKLSPCYLCMSSQAQIRDHAGIRIALCEGCNRYVVRIKTRGQA